MRNLLGIPKEFYMIEFPKRAFPVSPSLLKKSKGEATKCKTCKWFNDCRNNDPMMIACEKYERRKKKK